MAKQVSPTITTSASSFKDPNILSTWSYRRWVAIGCTMVFISLAKSIVAAASSRIWLEPMLARCAGYILADLVSGIYHWVIDNYGDVSMPFVGPQIEEFQGHHKEPRAITNRQCANNFHGLARAATFIMLPVNILSSNPVIHGLVGMCIGCLMFSQQFHAWAHCPKSKLPPLVVALQDVGVLLSRSQRAAPHKQPYNNNYWMVSRVWNKFLDNAKVFEALERFLFFQFRIRPRSWN